MQRQDPREVALELVVRRHQPAWDTIRVDRELIMGDDAVFAVAFDDLGAKPQRALLGLRRDGQGDWRSSGGSWGSPQPARETELWTMWGGWGSGGEELSSRAGVIAGWVADPDAIVARLTGGSGVTLNDKIESGVAVFLWAGDFKELDARVELLDAEDQVIRSGWLFPSRKV